MRANPSLWLAAGFLAVAVFHYLAYIELEPFNLAFALYFLADGLRIRSRQQATCKAYDAAGASNGESNGSSSARRQPDSPAGHRPV